MISSNLDYYVYTYMCVHDGLCIHMVLELGFWEDSLYSQTQTYVSGRTVCILRQSVLWGLNVSTVYTVGFFVICYVWLGVCMVSANTWIQRFKPYIYCHTLKHIVLYNITVQCCSLQYQVCLTLALVSGASRQHRQKCAHPLMPKLGDARHQSLGVQDQAVFQRIQGQKVLLQTLQVRLGE